MKKNIIILCISLILICISFTSVNAQEDRKERYRKEDKEREREREKDSERDKETYKAKRRVGIKGGVNFSSLYTKGADDTKMLTSFNLGLFAKLPVANQISLQPEIYYSPKGGEVSYKGNVIDGTALFNFRYLEVPLIIVVNITDNFNVQLGPYASLLLSSKVTNVSENNLFDFEENIDSKDNNKLDAGFVLGTGIDVGAISIGIRYNLGLTDVVSEKIFSGVSYTIPDANNGVINFYISLSLN
ncbi:MAG: porin family protein [Bacteroidales bacterium]